MSGMSTPILVLDTNVLVSALRSSTGASHRLIQLVDSGLFVIGVTVPLVLEYEAVCKRLIGSTTLTAHEIEQLIDYLCQIGKRSVVHFRLRPSVGDPDDEMVLEAAIASGSDWIVTHNVRDFAGGAARYGVEVLSPAEALRRLGVVR
jgi:putative PIN family toxin of toxin-antitoxin system